MEGVNDQLSDAKMCKLLIFKQVGVTVKSDKWVPIHTYSYTLHNTQCIQRLLSDLCTKRSDWAILEPLHVQFIVANNFSD